MALVGSTTALAQTETAAGVNVDTDEKSGAGFPDRSPSLRLAGSIGGNAGAVDDSGEVKR